MNRTNTVALRLLNTLRGFVFSATAGVSLLVFLGTTLASSLLYEKLLDERIQETSKEISRQNFNDIYQVLRNGGSGEQIKNVTVASKSAFPSTLVSVEVYRNRNVEILFGGKQTTPLSEEIRQVMDSGKETGTIAGGEVHYAYPVMAQQECLRCHTNAQSGEVLGVIAIRHTLQTVTAKVRFYYVELFLALGLLVLLAATAVSAFATRKIKHSVEALRNKVESVNSVRDFDQFDISRCDFGFDEFNQTFDSVAVLVEKMKCFAVDKDVLEFEIRLLEKFIITSNVVRDWRGFVKDLLLDINPIIEAYALVTIFRVEEEAYESEVFWRSTPSAETIQLFEKNLHRQIHDHPFFGDGVILHIAHNIADEKISLPDLSIHDIELQTKSLLLETPKIGGIVGIGVQSALSLDDVRRLVIGSILTTLLNLVGSVKAIYKYTKDLEHYATRDPLTDLYNQRMFWELLGQEPAVPSGITSNSA